MKDYKVRIHSNGTKEWYLDNKLHREDGPAVERADGDKAWFLNGKKLSERSFNIHNKRNNVLTKNVKINNYVQEMNMKLKSMNKYYF